MVSIDDLDAFRSWLIKKLQPVCDADPTALAKYVLALVKKDKPENDLKALCTEQLDVFLKKGTKGFVDDLFDSLRLKSYMKNADSPQHGMIREKSADRNKDPSNANKNVRSRSRSPRSREVRHRSPNDIRRRGPGDDHRSRRRSPDGSRRYYSRRQRSRSPSPRRRARSSASPPHRRKYRNNSPGRRSRSPHRKRSRSISHDRRDSPAKRSAEPNGKKMGRCFDYNEKGYCFKGELCPYDHGTDAIAVEDVTLAAAATGANLSANSQTDQNSGAAGGATDSSTNGGDAGKESSVKAETSGAASQMKAAAIAMHPVMPIPPPHPSLMQGHPPPLPMLPHHMRFPPPTIKFNIPPPRIIPPSLPPPPYNPELPSLRKDEHDSCLSMLPTVTVAMGNIRKRIVNDTMTSMRGVGGPPPNKRPFNNYNTKRVLLITNIPAMLNNITKLNEHFARFGAINNIQVKFDAKPDHAIVEFAHHASAKAAFTDTGAVLNNRFIRMRWFDPEQSASYNSSTCSSDTKPSVKDRLGTIPKPQEMKYTAPNITEKRNNDQAGSDTTTTATATSVSRTIVNPEAKATPPTAEEDNVKKAEELKRLNETKQKVLAARRKSARHQHEMQLKKVELQIQSQRHLAKQLKEQKKMMAKLDANPNMPAKERATIKNVLAGLDKSIQMIRAIANANDNDKKDQENKQQQQLQAKKDLLDTELDLYNASTSGENTISLRRRLNKLQFEAGAIQQAGIGAPSGGGYRGQYGRGGGSRGRGGRGRMVNSSYRFYRSGANLDRRPCQLRVSGFNEDEKDEMIAHFSEFGEIESFNFDEDNTTCTLKYKTRNDAEQAASVGTVFKKRNIHVSWVATQPKSTNSTVTPIKPTSALATSTPLASAAGAVVTSSNQADAATVDLTNNNNSNGATIAAITVTTETTEKTKTKTTVTSGSQQDDEEDEEDGINVEINPVETAVPFSPQQSLLDDDYGYEFLEEEDVLDEEELLTGADVEEEEDTSDQSWRR